MQTPRKSLTGNGSSEVPKRSSPGTSRSSRQSSGAGVESDSSTPSRHRVKTPTNGSPRVFDRHSPRSPASERKRPSKLNELETQITRLHEELKKTKKQLASSELQKKQAKQEVEEMNKQFTALTTKLEKTQLQLKELSEEEYAPIQELQKLSEERGKAWRSELEATQEQHVVVSSLLSATNEIQILKLQLEMAINSKSASDTKDAAIIDTELLAQEKDTTETLSLIENLKSQLMESTKFNEDNQQLVTDTQVQLEVANATIDTLRSDGLKAIESYNLMMAELAESKAQTSSLEETVKKLKEDGRFENGHLTSLEADSPRGQLDSFFLEAEQLKSALESAEIRNLEEQIKCTIQNQTAYEAAESMRMESNLRESKLESSLEETKHEISVMKENLIANETELRAISCQNEKLIAELNTLRRNPETESEKMCNGVADVAELKRKLMNKETELRAISCQNVKLSDELKTIGKNLDTESEKLGDVVTADVAELKRMLMDKETELQNVIEENELLKIEMEKKEAERSTSIKVVKTELEIARSAEQDALVRVGMLTEESDKTSRNLARTKEQLEAAQAAKSDMGTELKRLRVQTEQWRKAAEAAAAAAILTTENNGKVTKRSGSLDLGYNSIAGKLLSSPFSDDLDESSPKKKNSNVLKKIGGFLKKGQK